MFLISQFWHPKFPWEEPQGDEFDHEEYYPDSPSFGGDKKRECFPVPFFP